MTHLSTRHVLSFLVAFSALGVACGSDQKTANSPDDAAPVAAPVDTAMPQPAGDTAPPNGEPTNTPPSSPSSLNSPQRTDGANGNNSLATPGASSTPAAPALTEAQVAMITDLANTSEIEQAKLAQGKAKSAGVRKFAAMMIKHHGEAKANQAKLFQSLQLTPTQSPSATELKDSADRTLGSLRSASGAAFDTAYIESQIDAHQKVLDTLDQQLIPAAVDQPLIEELKKMRATVESHLVEAKNLQTELDQKRSH